jgi:membrane protein
MGTVSFNRHIGGRLSGVFRICKKSCSDMVEDKCFTQAAAISYYLVVSIFPLLLLLIGVAGFFLEPQETQGKALEWLGQYFPTGTRVLFRENIRAIVEARASISLFSSLSLLWSGTLMFDAINEAVNAAWGTQGQVRFLSGKLKSLLLIFIIVLTAFISTLLTAQGSLILHFETFLAGLPGAESTLWAGRTMLSLLWWLVPFLISVVAFGLAYRLLPAERVVLRDVWPAALAAAILWELSKLGFVWYVTAHANYAQIYGSLSAVLILMLWSYVSAVILSWGAQLSAEIRKARRNGQSMAE